MRFRVDRYEAFLLISSFIWGTSFAVSKIALEHIDPFYLALLRFIIGAELLLLVTLILRRFDLRVFKDPIIWMIGLLNAVGQFFQNFGYDSFYLGFGSKGEIVHNLNYWAEGVYESGHDFGDRGFAHRDYIEAFGWDFGIEKLFDLPLRPRLAGEYMFASGDAGRLFSPTNAAGGNRGDRGYGLRFGPADVHCAG